MKNEAEVLIVDDNPADVDLTREVLKRGKRRFHVNTVEDGEEALSFLRCEGKFAQAPRPDIILLDLNLPRKDSREVLSEVRSDPRLARIPVVIFTTSQASSDVNRSYELGANCYIQKPVDFDQFRETVKNVGLYWLVINETPVMLPIAQAAKRG
jgi:two-component system, chemotaxis family, response regulator Rcp1